MTSDENIPLEISEKLTEVELEAFRKIQDIKRRKREQGLLLFENMRDFKQATLDRKRLDHDKDIMENDVAHKKMLVILNRLTELNNRLEKDNEYIQKIRNVSEQSRIYLKQMEEVKKLQKSL